MPPAISRSLQYGTTLALVVLTGGGSATAAAWSQAAGLKIIVIAGEDAVNIIQQKTAVAPIVEVRDRNDLPVSGATVTFALGGGKTAAFAGGARTLTVTTNAAGRAAVTGLNPLASGAYQINVTATLQGQTATATISQTNVATAAAAQTAAGAAGAGAGVAAGSVAAAGAGGGGLSGLAIGAIAAAAGGGALVAVRAASSGDSSASSPASPTNPTSPIGPTGPTTTTYSGPFTGQMIITTNSSGSVCASTRAISGTLTMTLEQRADGTVTGMARTTGTKTEIAFTASPLCQALPGSGTPFNVGGPVTGMTGNLGFSSESSAIGPTPMGGSVTVANTTTFSGALSGGVITGTMTHTEVSAGQGSPSGGPINGSGTTSFPVTLR